MLFNLFVCSFFCCCFKNDRISTSTIETIAQTLPTDAPFYEFAEALRLVNGDVNADASDVNDSSTSKQHTPTPEWRALTELLRQQAEYRDYKRMVSSVDAHQNYGRQTLMQDFGKVRFILSM